LAFELSGFSGWLALALPLALSRSPQYWRLIFVTRYWKIDWYSHFAAKVSNSIRFFH
jgi:hypothetical protein